MSLPHFYLEDQLIAEEGLPVFALRLAAEDLRHARALRLAPGEHLALVDAAQDYFECEIVSFDQGAMRARIAKRLDAQQEGPAVVLVQGLAKGDKMDSVIRHATELGVVGFLPLACERSVVVLDRQRAAKRVERWRALAKSAAMQSGQSAVPQVSEPAGLAQACRDLAKADALLVCWEEAGPADRIDLALEAAFDRGLAEAADARVAVVVGPEGGLSSAEVEALLACNPQAAPVSLGPSILRTETAGVVAPALVLHELRALKRRTSGSGSGGHVAGGGRSGCAAAAF